MFRSKTHRIAHFKYVWLTEYKSNHTRLGWGGWMQKSKLSRDQSGGNWGWGGARPRMLSPSSTLTNQIPVGRPGTAARRADLRGRHGAR